MRAVEQPALGEVGDERAHPLVELGQEPVREGLEGVGVGVPAAQGDLDERHARLDELPGHQAARAERAAAVSVTHRGGFACRA